MMVYAVKDIKQGEEITLSYYDPLEDYINREEHFQQTYGFACKCDLCDFEQNDSKRDNRLALMEELNKYRGKSASDPDKVIDGVLPIIKKVGFRHSIHMFRFNLSMGFEVYYKQT